MKFSILVTCLNAGERLKSTVESILMQDYKDFEIIIEDGASSDGCLDLLPSDERIHVFVEKDKGIYDGMNRAISRATGEYLHFLNCGDRYYDEHSLSLVARAVEAYEQKSPGANTVIFYGDTYFDTLSLVVKSNPEINGFACFRHVPNHQACFYSKNAFEGRPYDMKYRICADYDHFLYSFYVRKADFVYVGGTVNRYEGNGFSETPENKEKMKQEQIAVRKTYMSKWELFKYRFFLCITLVTLRRKLAKSKVFGPLYNKIKSALYKR